MFFMAKYINHADWAKFENPVALAPGLQYNMLHANEILDKFIQTRMVGNRNTKKLLIHAFQNMCQATIMHNLTKR